MCTCIYIVHPLKCGYLSHSIDFTLSLIIELCSSTRALNGNKDNGPIFLDLRPGPAKETKAVERNDRCV